MPVRAVDDKPSDTLVVVSGEGFWTGSSTLPHLHQHSVSSSGGHARVCIAPIGSDRGCADEPAQDEPVHDVGRDHDRGASALVAFRRRKDPERRNPTPVADGPHGEAKRHTEHAPGCSRYEPPKKRVQEPAEGSESDMS